jgi:hypothetical protein
MIRKQGKPDENGMGRASTSTTQNAGSTRQTETLFLPCFVLVLCACFSGKTAHYVGTLTIFIAGFFCSIEEKFKILFWFYASSFTYFTLLFRRHIVRPIEKVSKKLNLKLFSFERNFHKKDIFRHFFILPPQRKIKSFFFY